MSASSRAWIVTVRNPFTDVGTSCCWLRLPGVCQIGRDPGPCASVILGGDPTSPLTHEPIRARSRTLMTRLIWSRQTD